LKGRRSGAGSRNFKNAAAIFAQENKLNGGDETYGTKKLFQSTRCIGSTEGKTGGIGGNGGLARAMGLRNDNDR